MLTGARALEQVLWRAENVGPASGTTTVSCATGGLVCVLVRYDATRSDQLRHSIIYMVQRPATDPVAYSTRATARTGHGRLSDHNVSQAFTTPGSRDRDRDMSTRPSPTNQFPMVAEFPVSAYDLPSRVHFEAQVHCSMTMHPSQEQQPRFCGDAHRGDGGFDD